MRFTSVVPLLPILATLAPVRAEEDPFGYRKLEPLLFEHCGDCHMDGIKKGGVSFDDLGGKVPLLEKAEMWRKVKEAVVFGDMPPEPEDTGFSGLYAEIIAGWIETNIETVDHSDPIYRDPGPAVVRPLTPTEYDNTIRDLLGLEFDVASECGIPEEIPLHGFSNNASAISMDPVILDKWFLAAEKVLEKFGAEEHTQRRREVFGEYPASAAEALPAAKRILHRLAGHAYRRGVNARVSDSLAPLFQQVYAQTRDFDLAVTKALKPVLVSPMFLFRMEKPEPTQGYAQNEVGFEVLDEELASRLSYFLWSTMPDDGLRERAAAGGLHEPEILRAEVERMLADPKADALADIFATQWLQIYKLDEALPSAAIYPSFDQELKDAMREETLAFFRHLIETDGSVLDLLDSDYTFLNERLAKHYGIEGVRGDEFRRVALRPEHKRGGILGMGSFLASTSHTDRTKPTLRGAYILEVVLGTPPTPPPAEASVFKKEPGEEVVIETFRDQLDFHASDPNCAACHKKIDPLGFALEKFDPIGRWFDTLDGDPIDNRGELPTGEQVVGFDQLKQVLAERQNLYLTSLTRQMMSYALGRETDYHDRATIEKIVERLRKNDYRFSEMIHGITESIQFRYRRKTSTKTPRSQ